MLLGVLRRFSHLEDLCCARRVGGTSEQSKGEILGEVGRGPLE